MSKDSQQIIKMCLLLLFSIFIHAGLTIIHNYYIQHLKYKAMRDFNYLLTNKIETNEVLKYLKVLINNYESLTDVSIIKERNLDQLKDAVKHIKIKQPKIFLKNTLVLNIIIFASVIMPGFSFCLRKLLKNKKKFNLLK